MRNRAHPLSPSWTGDAEQPAHVRFDRREFSLRDPEHFDRLAFAMRAVRLLKPPHMTVVVYPGNHAVRVRKGPDLRHGPNATWGMVAVPPHASRAEIAVAIASLTDHERRPFLLDLLMTQPAAAV
jgi:hypothetical protein